MVQTRMTISQFLLGNATGSGCCVEAVPDHGFVVTHKALAWTHFNWAWADQPASVAPLSAQLTAAGRKPAFAAPDGGIGPALANELEALGLKPSLTRHSVYLAEAGQIVSPLPAPPGGVTVVPAADPAAWLELLLDGFEVPENLRDAFRTAYAPLFAAGEPRLHLVEALADGRRAGAASLWLDCDIASLNVAAVHPEHRGRGVHGALFGARVARGLEWGARYVGVETAEEPVRRVATRFGLTEAMAYRFWS